MRQKTATVEQIQKLDKDAIEKYGVPSLALMENAGRLVADVVIKKAGRIKNPYVCIVCGLGNNAGDGFVVARYLINAGIKVKIFLIGRGCQLKHDAAVNYRILEKLKYPIVETQDIAPLNDITRADLIVDAIFGVGLNREVLDPFRSIIKSINKSGKKIISIDTPSGLDGTTGKIYGACIKADTTVTFSFIKKGFLKSQGPEHTGKVVVVDIGIPAQLKDKVGSKK